MQKTFSSFKKNLHPLISVVIPAYNEEKYITSLFEALLSQTFKNFEIVVIDNNSTDKTTEIAKKYHAKIINEEKQGYVFSLDRGIRSAQGKIIAVTDADTIPDNNWLEEIIKVFNDEKVVGLTGAIYLKIKSRILREILKELYSVFLKINFALGKPHLTGLNFAVKRACIIKVGGLDTSYEMSPDVNLGLNIKRYGRVVFAKNVIVTTSKRRWDKSLVNTFLEYTKGYVYTVWLRTPPPVNQKAIR